MFNEFFITEIKGKDQRHVYRGNGGGYTCSTGESPAVEFIEKADNNGIIGVTIYW